MVSESRKTSKRGLGNGLASLLGDIEQDIQQATNGNVDGNTANNAGQVLEIYKLYPGQYQPRHYFDDLALEELAQSLKESGMIQPILVRHKVKNDIACYEIIAGERRWRAAQKAKLHHVPVIIKELNDDVALQVSIVENIHREDLNAVEEAKAYKRLLDEFNYTQEDVSRLMGKSRSHVANNLRILTLPDMVLDMIGQQLISAGHARMLVNLDNPEDMAKEIVKKQLSVRDIEKKVKFIKNKKAPKPAAQKAADIVALEQELMDKIGLRASISTKGEAGHLTISYQELHQLEWVMQKLMA